MTLTTDMKTTLAAAFAAACTGGSFKITTSGGSVLETISGVTWSSSSNVATSSNPAASAIDASGTAAKLEIYNSSGVLQATLTLGTSSEENVVSSTTFTQNVTYDQGVVTVTF